MTSGIEVFHQPEVSKVIRVDCKLILQKNFVRVNNLIIIQIFILKPFENIFHEIIEGN